MRWQHRFLSEADEARAAPRGKIIVYRRTFQEFNTWLLRAGYRLDLETVNPIVIERFIDELTRRGTEMDFVRRAEHSLTDFASWLNARNSEGSRT